MNVSSLLRIYIQWFLYNTCTMFSVQGKPHWILF